MKNYYYFIAVICAIVTVFVFYGCGSDEKPNKTENSETKKSTGDNNAPLQTENKVNQNEKKETPDLNGLTTDEKDIKATIGELLKRLESKEEEENRVSIVKQLGETGDESVIKTLIELAKNDKDDGVRTTAAFALGNFKEKAEESIIKTLIEIIKNDKNDDVRTTAMSALGNFKEKAKDVIPVLEKIINNNKEEIQEFTFALLEKIGEPAIPTLIKIAENPKAYYTQNAIDSLANLCGKSEESVKTLIKIASAEEDKQDEKQEERQASIIQNLGQTSQPVAPVLIKILKEGNVKQKKTVIAILGLIGSRAKEVIPALIAGLNSIDKELHEEFINALEVVGRDAMPELKKVINDKSTPEFVKKGAQEALDAIREKAENEEKEK